MTRAPLGASGPVQTAASELSSRLGGVEPRLRYRAWLRDCDSAEVLFWRDNVPRMAGMIAFFGFPSVVPPTLLLLAAGGHLLGGMLSVHDVRALFQRVMSDLSQRQFLQTYWDPIRHGRIAATVLGVVSLLFGTVGLHDSIDWAVNRLWRSPGAHSFWIAKIRGLAVILWTTVFALLSLGLASASALVIGLTHALSVPGTVIALTPALLLDVAVFTALYTLTPTVNVRVRHSLPAAVLGADGAGIPEFEGEVASGIMSWPARSCWPAARCGEPSGHGAQAATTGDGDGYEMVYPDCGIERRHSDAAVGQRL